MNDPENPVQIPADQATKVLDSGYKSKIIIKVDDSQPNLIRFKVGNTKPTSSIGTALSPGEGIVLEANKSDLSGELWVFSEGNAVEIEVSFI